MNKLLSNLGLSFILVAISNAYGIEETNSLIEQRISVTGAIFTRDNSNPALGEAYKDPSGRIWGSVIMIGDEVNHMYQHNAIEYCKIGRSHLPSKKEFEQLAMYLGYEAAQGYSPYISGGRTEMLPGFSSEELWSSTPGPVYADNAYAFVGKTGQVGIGNTHAKGGVLCVSGN